MTLLRVLCSQFSDDSDNVHTAVSREGLGNNFKSVTNCSEWQLFDTLVLACLFVEARGDLHLCGTSSWY
jgi:hypothetical protein